MDTVRILSGGAAQGLVSGIVDRFRSEARCEVDGKFGAVGAMRDELLAGAPCDVVILTRALVDELAGGGHVFPETVADLGKVPTGVAVRAGEALPGIGSGDALRAALLAASAIYHPDGRLATAGIHFLGVLERLGIREAVDARLRAFPNGATAMRELAATSDARPIGVTQVTEILATPGVELVGPLPVGYGLATTYTAAVCSRALGPEVARALVARLAQAAAGPIGRDVGFEPL